MASRCRIMLECINLIPKLIIMILKDLVGLSERAVLNFKLLEHLTSIVVFTQLTVHDHRSLQELRHVGHKLVDYALGCTISLLHRVVLLFKLVHFPLEVEVLLFLHDFALLGQIVILAEESFRLIMDEVTEHLKGILLLDFFSLEELSHFGHSLPDVLKFEHLFLIVLLEAAHFIEGFLHLSIAFLDLLLLVLDELHHVPSLTDQFLICKSLLAQLILECF